MYGDTHVIRGMARSMRERAGDLRRDATDLSGRSEAVAWTGLAAAAMRRAARDHASGLRACAGAHDAAADALDRHAREVERLEDLIAAIEHRVLHALESAAGHLAGLAGLVGHFAPDPLDQWARHFEPPPHGSMAWLDVHVPRSA